MTVTGVAGTDGVVAIREITFPGLDIGRRLVVPASGGADTSFVLRARPPRRGCIDAGLGVSCGFVTDARVGEEESGMVREVTVTEDGRWDFDGAVVARSTPAAQRLLEPILEDTRVRASSTYLGEPEPGRPAGLRRRPAQLLGRGPGRPAARPSSCAGRTAAS